MMEYIIAIDLLDMVDNTPQIWRLVAGKYYSGKTIRKLSELKLVGQIPFVLVEEMMVEIDGLNKNGETICKLNAIRVITPKKE
jgi:hypothetical protein